MDMYVSRYTTSIDNHVLIPSPPRLTAAEQRQLEQRMQKRQVKEFMGVRYSTNQPPSKTGG